MYTHTYVYTGLDKIRSTVVHGGYNIIINK